MFVISISIISVESNKRAIIILLTLILTSVTIFFAENKFLVAQPRGSSLSGYETIKWINHVHQLIDDFEGINPDSISLQKNSFFSYGSIGIAVDTEQTDHTAIASKTTLKAIWRNTDAFGGWGKGIASNFELNPATDYLNFRIYIPKSNGNNNEKIKVILEEEDNDDGILEKDKDDTWGYTINIASQDTWQFISIPLNSFSDENEGGDNEFNATKKKGVHNIIFQFEQPAMYTARHKWFFDFICFSDKKITDNELIAIK